MAEGVEEGLEDPGPDPPLAEDLEDTGESSSNPPRSSETENSNPQNYNPNGDSNTQLNDSNTQQNDSNKSIELDQNQTKSINDILLNKPVSISCTSETTTESSLVKPDFTIVTFESSEVEPKKPNTDIGKDCSLVEPSALEDCSPVEPSAPNECSPVEPSALEDTAALSDKSHSEDRDVEKEKTSAQQVHSLNCFYLKSLTLGLSLSS